jgi:hypothetical protein
MRALPLLVALLSASSSAKPTFQDELRSKAQAAKASASGAGFAPPQVLSASSASLAAAAPLDSPFLLPSDDASLRARVAQAFADTARSLHGDGEGSSMTGVDLPQVLSAVLNPSGTVLSGEEEAEVARLCGRWAARAGFGGEEGASKPLPLALLQQHSATAFFREAAPKLLATRARARAAAREEAEKELAGAAPEGAPAEAAASP